MMRRQHRVSKCIAILRAQQHCQTVMSFILSFYHSINHTFHRFFAWLPSIPGISISISATIRLLCVRSRDTLMLPLISWCCGQNPTGLS